MGGKSKSSSPPVQQPPQQNAGADSAAMMAAMMPMMTTMMMQSQQSIPQVQAPPEPVITPSVDWATKQAELQKRIDADVTADLKRRRGRQSTVLTSPLVDDDNPSTVSTKAQGGPGPQ